MTTPPILVLKEGTASQGDVALLREAGVLVLVVKDVREVRYMDPPIIPASRFQRCADIIAKKIAHGKSIYTNEARDQLISALLGDVSPEEPISVPHIADAAEKPDGP